MPVSFHYFVMKHHKVGWGNHKAFTLPFFIFVHVNWKRVIRHIVFPFEEFLEIFITFRVERNDDSFLCFFVLGDAAIVIFVNLQNMKSLWGILVPISFSWLAFYDKNEFGELLRCVRNNIIYKFVIKPSCSSAQSSIQTFPRNSGHITGFTSEGPEVGLDNLIDRPLFSFHAAIGNLPALTIIEDRGVLIEQVIHFFLLLNIESMCLRMLNIKHLAIVIVRIHLK